MGIVIVITQHNFIKKMHSELLDDLKGPYESTPELEDIFKVDVNALNLNNKKQ